MAGQPNTGHVPRIYLPGLRCEDGRGTVPDISASGRERPLKKGHRFRGAPVAMARKARIAREVPKSEAAAKMGTDVPGQRIGPDRIGDEWMGRGRELLG